MEVFLYKTCKALFSALVVKEVEAERVKHCMDAQSSCLGSRIQMSPTCLYLLKSIMATFEVHKYPFWKISTYCVNKPYIVFFYFFFILYHQFQKV